MDKSIGKAKLPSCVGLSATPWTVVYPAAPSLGFSRKEYWSGLPFPSPGYFPTQGKDLGKPIYSYFPSVALPSEPPGKSDKDISTHKRELGDAICSNMNGPRDDHAKSGKDSYHMI